MAQLFALLKEQPAKTGIAFLSLQFSSFCCTGAKQDADGRRGLREAGGAAADAGAPAQHPPADPPHAGRRQWASQKV